LCIVLVDCCKILAYRTAIAPIIIVFPMVLAAGIGLHDVHISCKNTMLRKRFCSIELLWFGE
jgi:hypothetical protein